jgi:hypothetical protein
MIVNYELTDTFGGEANYSWVKRTSALISDKKTDLSILRMAKKWAGLSGIRSKVESMGDGFAIRPSGLHVVLFVTFEG